MLPQNFYVKRQINKVKGYEANFTPSSKVPIVIGFFKTKKEAREAVSDHKEKNKN